MSEDKTEEPTSKKLEDARKEGQLPQNKNILEAILLTFGMLITFGISSQLSQNVAGVFDAAILSISGNLENGFGPVMDAAWPPFQASLNIALSLGALILMVNLLLTRFNFTIKALEPKLNKFNPVNGLKQMFSMSIVYNFFRLLTYFIFAGTTLYILITYNLSDALEAAACGPACLAAVFRRLVIQAIVVMLLWLIIMAVIDFKIQHMLYMKQMRMTKDEIKREYKSSQGDPQIKGARTMQAKMDAMMPTIREVTHVIYSQAQMVGLIYRPGQVPYMAMKAQGSNVPKLVRQYRRSKAKCVNLPKIAREFYAMAPPGSYLKYQSGKGMAIVLRATGEL